MTRLDLENAIGRRLNKNTSSWDSATQTRIRHFLNQRHRRLMLLPSMSLFQRTTDTFPSVANTATYTITDTEKIERLYETTNDHTLAPLSLAEYREILPDTTAQTGTPTHYVIVSNVQPNIVLALYPTPSSAITYTLDVVVPITDLASDSAEPLVPEAFHFLLELGATLDELIKTDDPRYAVVKTEYDEGLRHLHYFVASQVSSMNQPRKWSGLGSWYPADRWL